jgi:hypothetical protein
MVTELNLSLFLIELVVLTDPLIFCRIHTEIRPFRTLVNLCNGHQKLAVLIFRIRETNSIADHYKLAPTISRLNFCNNPIGITRAILKLVVTNCINISDKITGTISKIRRTNLYEKSTETEGTITGAISVCIHQKLVKSITGLIFISTLLQLVTFRNDAIFSRNPIKIAWL